MNVETLNKINWKEEDFESQNMGYLLTVKLSYPEEAQKKHLLALCPEHKEIGYDDLSQYSQNCLMHLQKHPERYRSKKLLAHFGTRDYYTLHSFALRYYLQSGMRLEKIYSGISYTTSPWIRDYIKKISTLRAAAKTSFEKDKVFKRMANMVNNVNLTTSFF